MKKKYLFPFSVILAFIVYYGVKHSPNENKISNINSFNTFFKNEKGKIQTYSSTHEELKKSQISPANNERNPSSIRNSKMYNHLPMFKNRILLGIDKENFNEDEIKFINKINPEWKKLLGEDLLRFQSNQTKVIVEEEFNMIKVEAHNAKYVQQVVVNYLLKNGHSSSFKALVDSETGLVLETWDRTIHEGPRYKLPSLSSE